MSSEVDHYYSIYIVGGGQAGLELASRLDLHGIPYLVIESRKEQYKKIQELGIESIHGSGLDIKTFQKLSIRPVDTVVILTESDDRNMKIAMMVNKQLNHSKVITASINLESYPELGEIKVVNPYKIVASTIENEIMRPTTAHALTDSFGQYSVEEIPMRNKTMDRVYVKDIPFPQSGSLILIKRAGEVFIPHGDTHLLIGDLVTVIGNATALEEFRRILD